MKKALVILEAFSGRSIGHIEVIDEASKIDALKGHLYNKMEKIEVPVALENADKKDLKKIVVPDTWIKSGEADRSSEPFFAQDTWTKDSMPDLTVDPLDNTYAAYGSGEPDPRWSFVQSHSEISLKVTADYSKNERIIVEGSVLSNGIYTDLNNAFGTKKVEVATADYLTALAMQANPDFFAGNSLKVRIAAGSFSIGASINTVLQITNYSNSLLAKADQYALDRMLKYQSYDNSKASIEAE